jgi:hypothetical protein
MKKIFVLLLICSVALAAQAPAPQQRVFPPSAEQRAQIDAKLADLTARLNALAARKTGCGATSA